MDKKAVYLEWEDPESIDEWCEWDKIPNKLARIYSIGFIIKETKDMYVMALNVDPRNKSSSCTMLIPKKLVLKKRLIKDVRKTRTR